MFQASARSINPAPMLYYKKNIPLRNNVVPGGNIRHTRGAECESKVITERIRKKLYSLKTLGDGKCVHQGFIKHVSKIITDNGR